MNKELFAVDRNLSLTTIIKNPDIYTILPSCEVSGIKILNYLDVKNNCQMDIIGGYLSIQGDNMDIIDNSFTLLNKLSLNILN